MRKSRSKNFLCKISVYLFILWIIISVIKKIVNHDGVQRYNFIQRNTLGYWIWISLGFCLSKYFFKRYLYAPLFIFAILIIHEFLFYGLYINFLKDEGEVTNNFYTWFNTYKPYLKTNDLNKAKSDVSELLFSNQWDMSGPEALKHKYDTYYDYLKLEPGMKLLDIGCGNCHLLTYCKKKGVKCTGITIPGMASCDTRSSGSLKLCITSFEERSILIFLFTAFLFMSLSYSAPAACAFESPTKS